MSEEKLNKAPRPDARIHPCASSDGAPGPSPSGLSTSEEVRADAGEHKHYVEKKRVAMAKAHMRREITMRTHHLARQRLYKKLRLKRAKTAFFHSEQWIILPGLKGNDNESDSDNDSDAANGDAGSTPQHRKSHRQVLQALHKKYGACVKHWMHSCAIADVVSWFVYLILFTVYVQFHVLSSMEAESTISRQMKGFMGGPENLGDIQNQEQLYDFLENTLIANLAPQETNAAMLRFFSNYSAHNPSMNSINGRLFVLENAVWIRQERCSSAATCGRLAEPRTSETHVNDWKLNTTNAAMPAKCLSLQETPRKEYKKHITSSTTAEIRGRSVSLSGSGYVEHINLYLGSRTNVQNYTKSIKLSRECAQLKIQALRASGWIDDMTRAVSIEYCVAPWYAVPHLFDRTSVNRFLFTNDNSKYESFDTGGACQRIVFFIDLQGSISGIQATMTTPIRVVETGEDAAGHKANDSRLLSVMRGTRLRYEVIIISCVVICILKEGTELLYACHDGMVRTHYLNLTNIFWNILDIINIVALIWALIKFPAPERAPFGSTLAANNMGYETYARFKGIEDLNEAKGAFGTAVLFWFFRGVEYMRLMPWFELPINAMANSFFNLLSFGAFFLFIMWGASVAFRFMFATTSEEYTTLERSLTTLGLGSLGELSYDSILSDYRFKSIEVFSIAWAFIATFVLLTMFVAIVDQGFQDAKEQINPDPEVGDEVIVTQDLERLMLENAVERWKSGRTKPRPRGHIIEYEGHVEKANNDGTFDVRFHFAMPIETAEDEGEKINQKSSGKNKLSAIRTFRDRNLEKGHVRAKHPRDLSEGVLISLLRQEVHILRARCYHRGIRGFFNVWWGPRLLERLGCRPLRASPRNPKLHSLWRAHMKRYIGLRRAASGFMEAKDWEDGWKDAYDWSRDY